MQTTSGTRYFLSFWLGNVVDPTHAVGTASTVVVRIDGDGALTATNSSGSGTTSLAWQRFCVAFVASSSSTTIELVNGDLPNDNSNIVDDVTLY